MVLVLPIQCTSVHFIIYLQKIPNEFPKKIGDAQRDGRMAANHFQLHHRKLTTMIIKVQDH